MKLISSLLAASLILVFAPSLRTQSAQPKITPDVVYGHKDGLAMTFDVFTPSAPNGVGVLFMVSGGWVSTWTAPETAIRRFELLLARGFTVFSVRHGSSPRYKVPDASADIERAVRYIRLNASAFGVDPARLGAFGGSAGGHLALMLGLDPDAGNPQSRDAVLRTPSGVAAVVAWFPPVDLRGWTGPSERFPALDFPSAQAPSVSPIDFVSKDDPPVLLIHGDADMLVPIAHSQRLRAALASAGVTVDFVTIPGGDHGFTNPADAQRAMELTVSWFERHLLSRKK